VATHQPVQYGNLNKYENPLYIQLYIWGRTCQLPLIFSRNFPEHLNVTTRLADKMASSPVAGFRPFRSFFSFTQNLPKPETRTSSPDARDDLISSRRVSVISTGLIFGKAKTGLDLFYDIVFRQCHIDTPSMLVLEMKDRTNLRSQIFLFVSRGWCRLTRK
jgi:hypothetical protein